MNRSPAVFVVLLGLGAGSASSAAPPVAVETHVLLGVQALIVDDGKAQTATNLQQTEIGPSSPGSVELSVPWRPKGSSVKIRLVVRLTSMSPDGEATLSCESTANTGDAKPVQAAREIRLAEEGSGLFDVFGDGDRRILLTMQGERVERLVVRPPAVVGSPVKFLIGIERVDGERIVPLETNELHTFVGQPVEYSFRMGQDAGLQTIRLSVLPVSITGDLVTIDAEISGALPAASGTALLSRRERIVASRGATSRVQATTGTPPAGYQFQVTPDF